MLSNEVKFWLWVTLGAFLFSVGLFMTVRAEPALLGRVNDHAGVLSSPQRLALSNKLETIEKLEGKPQVVVLTVKSLEGKDIDTFRGDVFRAWKLGQAGANNGVLIVVAVEDRKIGIEVGYGLEGVLPDGETKRIIATEMVPKLKRGAEDWYGALEGAVGAIQMAIAREPVPVSAPSKGYPWGLILMGAPIGGWLFIWLPWVWLEKRREKAERERQRALRVEQLRLWAAEERMMAQRRSAMGLGVGAGAAGVVVASQPRPKPKPTSEAYSSRRKDDSYSTPSWPTSDNSYSSSSSSSSSSSDSSSSFSSGGGDSGGGGASSDF